MISESTIKALTIIRDNQIDFPSQFARLMWPDSPCWHRVYNVGHGASRGVAMNRAAGAYLGRLRKRGLILGYGSTQRFYLSHESYVLLEAK